MYIGSDASCIENFIYFIGIITVIIQKYKILRHIINGFEIHVISKLRREIRIKVRFGKWAVVTGCTDGIGLAYTKELAKRGVCIVLISRNLEKLETVSKQLEDEYKIETKIIQADFGKEGRELYTRIKKEIDGLDVGMLVNNVGVVNPYPMKLEEMEEDNLWDHLSVNVTAATMMASIILPEMKLKGRGIIVNVASMASLVPFPYLNVYAATKKYLVQFSRGLQMECAGSHVLIQTLLPGFVNTKMIEYSEELMQGGLFVPTAETYAKHAIKTIGFTDVTTGYLPHGFMFWIMKRLPEPLLIKLQTLIFLRFRKQYEAKLKKS